MTTSAGVLADAANCGAVTIVARLKKGLPYGAVRRFQKISQLPIEAIGRVARLSPRTLARRKAAGRLTSKESERLFRLSQIFDKAVALFDGDLVAARDWLQSPNRALGQQTPLALAESEIGAGEVEDLIGRLEHGVFA
jgi:putative toxin-antitoxin system antitoxin component (TIGR02293 family)